MDRHDRGNIASKKVFHMIMYVVKIDRGLNGC